MAFDQGRDFGRMRLGDVVVAARDDMQARVGNARFEVTADGDRADGIGIAP